MTYDLWSQLGFTESPYNTEPIPATEQGNRLLVGREMEIGRLSERLTSSTLHAAIEGDNGVGKTSLVSVAAWRLWNAFATSAREQAIVPLDVSFQLSQTESLTALKKRVYTAVVESFIKHRQALQHRGFDVPDDSDLRNVQRWLQDPLFTDIGGGLTIFGSGGNASRSTQPNPGFGDGGFFTVVDRWLRDTFPSGRKGGFVCIIDNLELLETSQVARAQLEAMRDELLGQRGLKWVLCGARGIVTTSASSPRLEGRLAQPMELGPVDEGFLPEVIAQRIGVYGARPETVAPVGTAEFLWLYEILRRNLRNSFRHCEDFSFWLLENQNVGRLDDYPELFRIWLTTRAERYNEATELGGRAWEVFDYLADGLEGACSPSDFEMFGFNSPMALRPHVKALEDNGLTVSTVDDRDKRRKTIGVTPRGWLVRFHRRGYRV